MGVVNASAAEFDFWRDNAHRVERGGIMSRRLILAIGLLVLTTGCLARGMGPIAADLPVQRPLPSQTLDDDKVPGARATVGAEVHRPVGDVLIPVLHPPDAKIIAREPAFLLGPVNWSLLAILIAF